MSSLPRVSTILKSPSVSVAGLFMAIGLFAVAFLASESPPSQSPAGAVAWSGFVSVLIAMCFTAGWLVLRQVSAVLGHLVLAGYVVFTFYGHIQGIFWSFIRNELIFSDKIFLLLLVVSTLFIYFIASRFVTWNSTIARYALAIMLALILWNLTLWGVGQVLDQAPSNGIGTRHPTDDIVLDRPDQLFPVYWMIFDEYAREDVLDRHFGFDNSPFLGQLENRGFVVNRKAITSFVYTRMSIPALMELENLGTADPVLVRSILANRRPRYWRFEESKLARLFADIGYRVQEFSDGQSSLAATTAFSLSFYESTGLRALPKELQLWRNLLMAGHGFMKNMELTVEQASAQDVFIFSYNSPPHPPARYDSTGRILKSDLLEPDAKMRQKQSQQKDTYIGELQFVNAQILMAVDRILESSPVDPLIIIMSDHGTNTNFPEGSYHENPNEALFYERIAILSAVHLPESCAASSLGESNTSLNTLRLILNSCFKTDLSLEPHDVYWGNPFVNTTHHLRLFPWFGTVFDFDAFIHYPDAIWSADIGTD